jgi:hypothetical protein
MRLAFAVDGFREELARLAEACRPFRSWAAVLVRLAGHPA